MDDIITIEECITRLDAIRHEIVSNSRDHFALSAGIAALYEMEKNAPAVSRWIPCSERLPENKGRYLCSLYYAIPPYHLLHPENDKYIRDVSVQYFDGKSFIASVIAWMPMPDAYEPTESEVHGDAYTRARDDDYNEF